MTGKLALSVSFASLWAMSWSSQEYISNRLPDDPESIVMAYLRFCSGSSTGALVHFHFITRISSPTLVQLGQFKDRLWAVWVRVSLGVEPIPDACIQLTAMSKPSTSSAKATPPSIRSQINNKLLETGEYARYQNQIKHSS